MTLRRRHSMTVCEADTAFLRFGVIAFVLTTTLCGARSDVTVNGYDSRISRSHDVTRARGIFSIQGNSRVHVPQQTSGEHSVDPSSDVKHEYVKQGLSIADRTLGTKGEHYPEQIQLERALRNLQSSEPRLVGAGKHEDDDLQAALETRPRRRQLRQMGEVQAEDQAQTNSEHEGKEEDGNVEAKKALQKSRNQEVKNQEMDESKVNVENDQESVKGKEIVKEAEQGAEGFETGKDGKEQQEEEAEKKESEEQQPEKKPEKTLEEKRKAADHYRFPEPYFLGPKISDWDAQRAKWLKENPHMRYTSTGKPRVLLVTGSSGSECPNGQGDNFYVRSLKLKIDYARVHNYELFYNLAEWDPLFNGFWVKLPTFRNLMLTHPEIEWIFWLDSDAIFTDLLYEAPLEDFDGYNMIMEGWFTHLMENSWLAANAGVVLLRNCQWSLDLIDKWSPMGADGPARVTYGQMLTEFFTDRENDFPSDDQAALSYIMIMDEAVMSKIKLLESKVQMSGYWKNIVDKYEHYLENHYPGLGDDRWPWVTHFTGCSLCFREREHPELKECMDAFQRAYNFADNQMMAYWGFQYKNLFGPELVRIRNETSRPVDLVDVNPWQERIDQLAAASKR